MAYTLNDTSISITVDDSEYNRCMNSLSQTAEKTFQTIAGLAANSLSSAPLEPSLNFQAAFTELRAVVESLGEQLTSGIQPGINTLDEMLVSMGKIREGIAQFESSLKSLSDNFLQLQKDSGGAMSTVNSTLIGQIMSIGTVSGQGANSLRAMAASFSSLRAAAGTVAGALGPVGITMLAVGATYAAHTLLIEQYNNELEGAISYSEKAAETARAQADANREARINDNSAMSRLQELTKYESLNNAEKVEAEGLIKQLTDRYGNLGIQIDTVSGKLIVGAGAFKKMTDAQTKEYGKDLSRQMGATLSEISSLQNGAHKELGSWFTNTGFNQVATTAASAMANVFGFSDKNKQEIESTRFTGLQNELTAAMELQKTEDKISKLEGIRLKLLSENDKERAAAIEKLIKKLKELQGFEKEQTALKKDRKPNDKPGVTDKTPKEVSEAERKAQEARKKQKEVQSNALKEEDFNRRYQNADAVEKNALLDEKLKELEAQKQASFQARGYKDTGNVADYTQEELEYERKRRSLIQQKAGLQKAADDRTKQINQRDADRERQKESSLAEKTLNRKVEDLRNQGKSGEALGLLISEQAKADEELSKAKATFEELKQKSAGKILDENSAKALADAEAKFVEKDKNKEKIDDKVYSTQEESKKEMRDSRKASIAFSSENLTAMLGDKTPEMETAKNTKEMVRLTQKTNDQLVKNSGGEVIE